MSVSFSSFPLGMEALSRDLGLSASNEKTKGQFGFVKVASDSDSESFLQKEDSVHISQEARALSAHTFSSGSSDGGLGISASESSFGEKEDEGSVGVESGLAAESEDVSEQALEQVKEKIEKVEEEIAKLEAEVQAETGEGKKVKEMQLQMKQAELVELLSQLEKTMKTQSQG